MLAAGGRTAVSVSHRPRGCHNNINRHHPVLVVAPAFMSSSRRRLRRHCYSTSHHNGRRGIVGLAAASFSSGRQSTNKHSSISSVGNSTLPSSPPPATSYSSTDQRIQDLLTHPAMNWKSATTFASMHKKKLGVRHLPLFDHRHRQHQHQAADPKSTNIATNTECEDYLFDEFASAICHANVIPRKELFETWSAALHIHSSYFGDDALTMTMNADDDEWNAVVPVRRAVDVAAGHGLLAWALLLLDDEYQRSSRRHQQLPLSPLTAFCLDIQMPPSATLIHASMVQHFPHLESRFDYVEGRLEQLVPHPTCLLASVHGCGILTDMLVATAAEQKVPLAVVPCCHSRKLIVLEVASRYAKDAYEDILLHNSKDRIPNLADRLDRARVTAMRNAGLEVKEVYLPKMFTDKNRLIMGFPSTTTPEIAQGCAPLSSISSSQVNLPTEKTTFMSRGNNMPPLNNHQSDATGVLRPKPRYMKGFYIPCQDSLVHRQLITQLSGKEAGNSRKKVMHNRNNTQSPQLDVSLWLPPHDKDKTDGIVSETSLSSLIAEILMSNQQQAGIQCTVNKTGRCVHSPHLGTEGANIPNNIRRLIIIIGRQQHEWRGGR